ncbi:UxaA family hydrolase [Coraliomargarita akajimensis]|uniref:SAF domain protein n=1 Tax=Coraliomargarita akajimensis (strain DSM 45221 / IAM 15411 / JCM 23193 / KCTC 12865 / 04OKA010-24) TaxID=583355 RepID=D5ENA7_CORAD|nr:UxaA family hydrolase [Coraliomargarita akajimensis]ADE53542.1 SAF domain protein [Coraliomargarita akajimensis DSM 45221]
MARAFVIDSQDNVATVLEAVPADEVVTLLGDGQTATCTAIECIRAEHKLAILPITKGAAVVKYGMPIGQATKDIEAGEWVHLHNCVSNYDERSGTLNHESGAPSDIEYV